MKDLSMSGLLSPELAVVLQKRGYSHVLSCRYYYVYPAVPGKFAVEGWQLQTSQEVDALPHKDDLHFVPTYTIDDLLLGLGALKPRGVTVLFGTDSCMYAHVRVTRPDGAKSKYLESSTSFLELLVHILCYIADSGFLQE